MGACERALGCHESQLHHLETAQLSTVAVTLVVITLHQEQPFYTGALERCLPRIYRQPTQFYADPVV